MGARQDLPLVKSGEAQAARLGEKLRELSLIPQRIVSGPLKRTRRAAEIVKAITASDAGIDIDKRLTEIDYGSWGGKTDGEIVARFGPEAISNWREDHQRPDNAGWTPDDATLRSNAMAVLAGMEAADLRPRHHLQWHFAVLPCGDRIYGRCQGEDRSCLRGAS